MAYYKSDNHFIQYLNKGDLSFRMQSFGTEAFHDRNRSSLVKKWDAFTNYLEENRQHIFFLFVFYVITLALFIERFVCEFAEVLKVHMFS